MKTNLNKTRERKNVKRLPVFKFAKERVTVIAFLDKRNMKENERYPVRICVTFNSKQVYYTPGIDLSEAEYTDLNTNKKGAQDRKSFIKKHFDIVEEHVKDLIDSLDGFSLEALNKRLSKGKKNSIADGFAAKVAELKQYGKLGTADWYDYTLKSIQSYTSKDLKYSDITVKWLHDYEKWMTEKNQTITTISMRMRAIQSILKIAQKENVITASQWPFGSEKDGKYLIPEGEGRKLALTLQQIGEILKYETKSKVVDRCRDLWLFSYLTNGINMNDMLRLKYSNIVNDEICFYRLKTIKTKKKQKEIKAAIIPKMSEIIEKWGNPERKPENYIFPFLQPGMYAEEERKTIKTVTRLINKKISDIGKALSICKLSTYTARHSFASILKRSGANISYISESLGHADLKTTENYLAGFEKEERVKNSQKLMPDYTPQFKIAK